MMAIGLALIFLGYIGHKICPSSQYGWDKRDWVSTAPGILGMLLCVASVVVWSWRALP